MFYAFYEAALMWLGGLAALIDQLPLSYALGAGMLASINPCGFIMLPAFAAFYLTAGEGGAVTGAGLKLRRALQMGGLVTAAFIATFGLAGIVVAFAGEALLRWSGWAGLSVGIALIGLGVVQIATRRAVFAGIVPGLRVTPGATPAGVVMFGAGYALASLSCTLPVFLTVVSGAFIEGRLWRAVGDFVQYALGMGLVLTMVTIGVGLFQEQTLRLAARVMPYVATVGNVAMVAAGSYLVWYWTTLGALL